MNWKRYQRRSGFKVQEPKGPSVRLSSRGQARFNSSLAARFPKAKTANLLYDDESGVVIGVEILDDVSGVATIGTEHGNRFITVNALLKGCGVKLTNAVWYPVTFGDGVDFHFRLTAHKPAQLGLSSNGGPMELSIGNAIADALSCAANGVPPQDIVSHCRNLNTADIVKLVAKHQGLIEEIASCTSKAERHACLKKIAARFADWSREAALA